MPWNEPGGNDNKQQDPWTGKNKNNKGQNADELIDQLSNKLGGLFSNKKKSGGDNGDGGDDNRSSGNGFNFSNPGLRGIAILLAIVLGFWLVSGFYTVDARQQALVLRFGAYVDTKGPGLHWHIPYPVETYEAVEVAQNRSAQDRSTMLTKDENIVDIAVTVQYKVNDIEDYVFNVFMPDNLIDQTRGTLYQAMRSATREVVGRSNMDFILREGREQIAQDVHKLMQSILDGYKAGLEVLKVNLTYAEAPEAVKEAFDDANRAREDANRFINEADQYSNKILPEARGRAARLLEEANAYRAQTIARAEGDASRFSQLVSEYRKAPEVTRERLYLETMESVMGDSRKILIDSKNSNNLLYMPLDKNTPISQRDIPSPGQLVAPLASQLQNSNTSSSRRQQRTLTPNASRESR